MFGLALRLNQLVRLLLSVVFVMLVEPQVTYAPISVALETEYVAWAHAGMAEPEDGANGNTGNCPKAGKHRNIRIHFMVSSW